jgi:alkaline phosphatase D
MADVFKFKESCAALLFACCAAAALADPNLPPNEPVRNIVFGSCLNLTEHPMLDRTLTLPMDLFIFLGDNIYADTVDMAVMRRKYGQLKESRFFRELRKTAVILATWDDHDLGVNDGGCDYPMRRESQREFLDWLDVPDESPLRRQEGVYDARVFGPPGKQLQVVLLDTRYFRSPLSKGEHGAVPSGGPYVPNKDPAATMLGPAQWRWLEGQLLEPAEIRLIISSIQFVSEFSGAEAWANMPLEKQRLLDLLRRTSASGVIFLSGDRHWCELSRMDGPLGYPLYDLTASAMTQVHPRGTPTPNRYRHHPRTYHEPSAGRMRIEWDEEDPRITLEIIAADGAMPIQQKIRLSELQGNPATPKP